jgi:molybdenum cofactor biosynthesis protein MoaC
LLLLLLPQVDVQLQLQEQDHSVRVSATAVTVGQTGVEMEALTAASVAALTVYDMCKAVSKDIRVTDLQLEAKEGGRSGTYTREPPAA